MENEKDSINLDRGKIKEFCKRRDEKFNRRKKWAIPLLILIFLGLGYLSYDKYSCTWDNNDTYSNDNVYFYEGLKTKCIALSDFDIEYMGGALRKCLEEFPSDTPFSCIKTNNYDFNITGLQNE